MDSAVTGMLTIFCHHTFHCGCLAQWGDGSCPVCRYSQTLPKSDTENFCNMCGESQRLWICLICGNIGCGRYQKACAYLHYRETGHVYAMELETQRVWDYVGDGYVHRLIQNKTDGKLVELPGPWPSGGDHENNGQFNSSPYESDLSKHLPVEQQHHQRQIERQEKMDEIGLELSNLLNTSLESQRLWYESKLDQLSQSKHDTEEKMKQMHTNLQNATDKLEEAQETMKNQKRLLLEQKIYQERIERKCSKLNEKFSETLRQRADDQEIYSSLKNKYDILLKDQQAKEKELQDSREQVHDLMVFLDTKEKISASSSDMKKEIQEGQIFLESKARPQQSRQRQR